MKDKHRQDSYFKSCKCIVNIARSLFKLNVCNCLISICSSHEILFFLCVHCCEDWKGRSNIFCFSSLGQLSVVGPKKKKKKGKESRRFGLHATLLPRLQIAPRSDRWKASCSRTGPGPGDRPQSSRPCWDPKPASSLWPPPRPRDVAPSGPASLTSTSEDLNGLSQTRSVNRSWLSAASWEPFHHCLLLTRAPFAASLRQATSAIGDGRVRPRTPSYA